MIELAVARSLDDLANGPPSNSKFEAWKPAISGPAGASPAARHHAEASRHGRLRLGFDDGKALDLAIVAHDAGSPTDYFERRRFAR